MQKLVQNLRLHLVDALVYLSDFEAQYQYKRAVPSVHIPVELYEQMRQFHPEKSQRAWYKDVVPNKHVSESLLILFNTLDTHFQTSSKKRSDVPAVFEYESWKGVRVASSQVLVELYQTTEYQETLGFYW